MKKEITGRFTPGNWGESYFVLNQNMKKAAEAASQCFDDYNIDQAIADLLSEPECVGYCDDGKKIYVDYQHSCDDISDIFITMCDM